MNTSTNVIKITCTKCKKEKETSFFSPDLRNPTLLQSHCNPCRYLKDKIYKRTKTGLVSRIYGSQVRSSKDRGHDKPKYSKKDFSEWLLNNPCFENIYQNWVLSDYDTYLRPSVDRLDDYKGYSFDNIRLVTWIENKTKSHKDMYNGINKKQLKPVLQYSKDGVFIKEYYSMKHASRETNTNFCNMSQVCLGHKRSAGGFIWKYVTDLKEIINKSPDF
jgi:hypothetical protein